MPAPTSADEFLQLARKSGVLDERRLDAYLETYTATEALPAEPARLAGILVRDGLLTHFQAEQFLLGKWRRFTIGKYKVLERLGAGGMGSVYLCEHKLMRRRVAVKVLPTAKADDPAALERFYREARAVAALDHPNIVRAYDIDQDDKLHFLVMEHVDGSNLQEIVKKSGPLDPIRAAHYIHQAALGLQHAHESAGLVHRDIKPGNILVDRNGIVKVLDMGLARFFHDQEDNLTKKFDENVLGTADYLAPEQAIDSHGVDIRADIYSLGATFYFCLTGRTPFNEGSVAQKLIWHQTRRWSRRRCRRRSVSGLRRRRKWRRR
jgi:serine/threonine protein kinase